jgi:hypothetical protein
MRATEQNTPKTSLLNRAVTVYHLFSSVKFAVTVVVLIALACILGTVIPQGSDALQYVRKIPSAAPRMQFFAGLGLTSVFTNAWFITLLCVLAASVAACTTRRVATAKRTTGSARRRAIGSMLTHISLLLILTGGVVRAIWGEKGFIEFREGQTVSHFRNEKGEQRLPFAISLTHFQIETDATPRIGVTEPKSAPAQDDANQLLIEWPERQLTARVPLHLNLEQTLTPPGEPVSDTNTFRITVLNYLPDFTMDTGSKEAHSRSDLPNNPAILVAVVGPEYHNHRWLFARFPDFSVPVEGGEKPSPLRLRFLDRAPVTAASPSGPVKNYKSTVTLAAGNTLSKDRTIGVNQPLKFKGYAFYQTGYNPEDLSWSTLEVVRDPGVPVVYAGFVFLIAGLFVVFYLNPWLAARKA